jgi:hypothetical protein
MGNVQSEQRGLSPMKTLAREDFPAPVDPIMVMCCLGRSSSSLQINKLLKRFNNPAVLKLGVATLFRVARLFLRVAKIYPIFLLKLNFDISKVHNDLFWFPIFFVIVQFFNQNKLI